MSRIPATTWPFGPGAAESRPEFENVRKVRTEAIFSVALAALILVAVVVHTLLGLVLCLVATFVVAALLGVYEFRAADRPSAPVSPERSLALTRTFWLAKLAAGALLLGLWFLVLD